MTQKEIEAADIIIKNATNKEPSVVVPAPIVPLKENTTKPTNVEGEKD